MTKPTKWHVRSSKTQISLGVRPVWSESSLSTWRKLGSLTTHWAHSEDSDQTGRMPRLIWVFVGRTCHFVGFVMRWLNSTLIPTFEKWTDVFNCHSLLSKFWKKCLSKSRFRYNIKAIFKLHVSRGLYESLWTVRCHIPARQDLVRWQSINCIKTRI